MGKRDQEEGEACLKMLVYVFSIFKHLAIFSLICKGFKESLGNRVGRKKMRNKGWGWRKVLEYFWNQERGGGIWAYSQGHRGWKWGPKREKRGPGSGWREKEKRYGGEGWGLVLRSGREGRICNWGSGEREMKMGERCRLEIGRKWGRRW